jgi:hypothetical protein
MRFRAIYEKLIGRREEAPQPAPIPMHDRAEAAYRFRNHMYGKATDDWKATIDKFTKGETDPTVKYIFVDMQKKKIDPIHLFYWALRNAENIPRGEYLEEGLAEMALQDPDYAIYGLNREEWESVMRSIGAEFVTAYRMCEMKSVGLQVEPHQNQKDGNLVYLTLKDPQHVQEFFDAYDTCVREHEGQEQSPAQE